MIAIATVVPQDHQVAVRGIERDIDVSVVIEIAQSQRSSIK